MRWNKRAYGTHQGQDAETVNAIPSSLLQVSDIFETIYFSDIVPGQQDLAAVENIQEMIKQDCLEAITGRHEKWWF